MKYQSLDNNVNLFREKWWKEANKTESMWKKLEIDILKDCDQRINDFLMNKYDNIESISSQSSHTFDVVGEYQDWFNMIDCPYTKLSKICLKIEHHIKQDLKMMCNINIIESFNNKKHIYTIKVQIFPIMLAGSYNCCIL